MNVSQILLLFETRASLRMCFAVILHVCLMRRMLLLCFNVWQSILSVLSKEQFSTVAFNQQAPVPLQTKHREMTNTSIVTHCILRHSTGHVIHLVIFYQRGDEQFLWHSSLPDLQHLGMTVDSVQFGRHEGAYNRWMLVHFHWHLTNGLH